MPAANTTTIESRNFATIKHYIVELGCIRDSYDTPSMTQDEAILDYLDRYQDCQILTHLLKAGFRLARGLEYEQVLATVEIVRMDLTELIEARQ